MTPFAVPPHLLADRRVRRYAPELHLVPVCGAGCVPFRKNRTGVGVLLAEVAKKLE